MESYWLEKSSRDTQHALVHTARQLIGWRGGARTLPVQRWTAPSVTRAFREQR